jgi:methylmalonyl-CoA mutase C-terminal domain/subunit
MGRLSNSRGKILVTKVGLDGHDRGAKVLSRILGDQGFEVTYMGVRSTAEQLAAVAIEEQVDVVAISLLSGAHIEVARAVRSALDSLGLKHIAIAMGGLIPQHDAGSLHNLGVARCFHPGHDTSNPVKIAEAIDELVAQSRDMSAAAKS